MTLASAKATTSQPVHAWMTLRRACRLALFCAMTYFFCLFLSLTFGLYDQFAYMTFDLGIFDQAVWLIAQGHSPFVTARGVHILGDHFSVLLYLLAPLYRLFPGPKTLLCVQTLAMTLGAVPAYALARKRLHSEWKGLLFGCAYLLYPAHQWSITYEFHPDTFATPLLFTALYAVQAKRFRLYAAALALTALIKESAGVTIICVGLWAFFPHRKEGALTMLFGAIMLPVSMLTVRCFNGGQPSPYFSIFQHFGASPLAMMGHFARHPLGFMADMLQQGNLYYLDLLLFSLCFLPLLSPETLLLAMPMLVINFMAGRPGMHTIEEYYNAFLTPFLFLGAIIGFGRMEKWWLTRWFVYLNLPLWVVAGISLSPFARPVAELYSARPPAQAVVECRIAVALIPPGASVSAQMALGPHLSNRTRLYTFPNPFAPVAYGGTYRALMEIDSVTGSTLPADLERAITQNAPDAEYIALCPRSNPFPLSDTNYTRCVVALLQSRHYETVYVGSYVMVLKRVAPGHAILRQLSARAGMPTQTTAQIEAAYWHWLVVQYSPTQRGVL